jgi:hypothetical protein
MRKIENKFSQFESASDWLRTSGTSHVLSRMSTDLTKTILRRRPISLTARANICDKRIDGKCVVDLELEIG